MLTVKDLHKSYQVGKTTYEVLKGVSLQVEKGEFVAVMGPSGSGKTTLLNCISCYIPADSGQITLGKTELAHLGEDALAQVRNRQLGFVFQDFLLLDGLTVRENILLPAIIGGTVNSQVEERADQLCDVFGIGHIRGKYPAEISGGEKQRTAVARALINRPLLILADEPTGNLDSKSSRAVIRSFEQARDALEATIFMVTHDSFAASFCDRVVILRDGVVWQTLEKGDTDRAAFQDRLLRRHPGHGEGVRTMTTFSQVYAALRRKNKGQYALLAGCSFFSVLLITAYACMMRSPTILTVLPEGGDSRKQVMMVFVLAVIGCAVFTTYAAGCSSGRSPGRPACFWPWGPPGSSSGGSWGRSWP